MTTQNVKTLITAEELSNNQAYEDYELIRGELVKMSPPPENPHGLVAGQVAAFLFQHVLQLRVGRVRVEQGFLATQHPDSVRAPDVAFIRSERVMDAAAAGWTVGAPDIAAEVVSESDRFHEVHAKAEMWIEAGARLIWVVDPMSKRVHVDPS